MTSFTFFAGEIAASPSDAVLQSRRDGASTTWQTRLKVHAKRDEPRWSIWQRPRSALCGVRCARRHCLSFKLEPALSANNPSSKPDNSPWTQVTILGCVTFCSVGMFSAVSGLGAGYVDLRFKRSGVDSSINPITNDRFSTVVPRTPSSPTRQMEFSMAVSPSPASLPVRSTYVALPGAASRCYTGTWRSQLTLYHLSIRTCSVRD